MQSKQAQTAKQHAKNQGLEDKHIDKVFFRLLNGDTGRAFDDKLHDAIKADFSDPKKMEFVDEIIQSEVQLNGEKYTGKLLHRMLRDAAGSEKPKVDGEYGQ